MKLFNRNIFALLASLSLLTSCSDDVLLDKDTDSSDSGIVFYVPDVPEGMNPDSGTRAVGNVSDFNGNEAEIKNLRIFAYKDGAQNPIVIKLVSEGVLVSEGRIVSDVNGYKGYQIKTDLENGEYEMYAIANSSISDATTKSALLQATATVPDNISVSGLPMSCSNERMMVSKTGNFTPVGSNNTISVESGQSIKIKADLHFAVAKVRVTLLNDLRPGELMGAAKVERHANASSLIEGGAIPSGTASTSITGNYYTLDRSTITEDLLNMNIEKSNLTSMTPAANGTTPWIWQTVFYVPERLTQTASDGMAVTMNVGGSSKELKIGSSSNGGTTKIVQRSNFYDYVGTIDGNFKLALQPWTPAVLAGFLDGSYWLDVDKTYAQISAGYNFEINYKSNTAVIPDCEKYNNQDIYSFDMTTPGKILVTLNPQIDKEEFPLMKAENKWKYFTLSAGTIVKKIDVSSIDFTEFITPSTDMVTIDVNERKSSGQYSGDIELSIRTNLSKIQFSKENWQTSADAGSPASLILQNASGTTLAMNTPIAVPSNGILNIKVHFNDLNSNRDLWKANYDMKLNITGVNNSGQTIADTKTTVMVYVRSKTDTYRIHLKASGWEHPHIYAYQILELPSNHPTNKNAPVGSDGGGYGRTAALEYSFTGAVAFKGWNVGDYNDPNSGGKFQNEFFYFNYVLGGDESWNADNQYASNHYYLNMDFCSEHRAKLANESYKCSQCSGTAIERTWPGIHMLKEPKSAANNNEDDWWYFDLTGVATPGKTLIIFNDCYYNNHNDTRDGHRYPGYRTQDVPMPGVPLFDYPSKEGWFVYTNSSTLTTFLSACPGTEQAEVDNTNTVYYTVPSGYYWQNVYAYYWNGGNNYGHSWPGTPMTKQSDGRWMIKVPKDAKEIIFNNGGSGKGNQTNNITLVNENNHSYTGYVQTN